MSAPVVLMTAEDLLMLPQGHMRHELVRGELITMAPTSGEHGLSSFNIAGALGAFLKTHDLGVGAGAETGFLIGRDPDTVRAPDCAFIRKDRIPASGVLRKFWNIAPDLAVEVLSPSDSAGKVLEKIDEWLAAGARLVWVVDPDRKAVTFYAPNRQSHTLGQGEQLSGEDVLPGFQLPVAEIFR